MGRINVKSWVEPTNPAKEKMRRRLMNTIKFEGAFIQMKPFELDDRSFEEIRASQEAYMWREKLVKAIVNESNGRLVLLPLRNGYKVVFAARRAA